MIRTYLGIFRVFDNAKFSMANKMIRRTSSNDTT